MSGRASRWRAGGLLTAVAVGVLAMAPSGAQASLLIGLGGLTPSFVTPVPCGVSGGCTFVAVANTGRPVTVTTASVITSWNAGNDGNTRTLRVIRPGSAGAGSVVASSAPENGSPPYAARIRIAPGDLVGYSIPQNDLYVLVGCSGGTSVYTDVGSVSDGSAVVLPQPPFAGCSIVNLTATTEVDADGDGFGDQTQDECPGLASRQAPPCVEPPAPTPAPAPPATPDPGSSSRDTLAPTLANVTVASGKLLLTTSEAGRVRVTLTLLAKGIRRGRACVRTPKRRPKRARSCVRRVPAGTQTVDIAIGGARLTLPRGALRAGRYEARATLTDAAGNTSRPARATFTVKA